MSFSARERDVTSSLDEFAAGLEKACPGKVTRLAQHSPASIEVHFLIDTPAACIEIATRKGPPRVIASLALPTLQVRFAPRRGAPEAIEALIRHLDRSMHRGGG